MTNFSFAGWAMGRFLLGRKKTAITILGFLLGFYISDNELVAVASAAIVESGFAIMEYFIKKKEM